MKIVGMEVKYILLFTVCKILCIVDMWCCCYCCSSVLYIWY